MVNKPTNKQNMTCAIVYNNYVTTFASCIYIEVYTNMMTLVYVQDPLVFKSKYVDTCIIMYIQDVRIGIKDKNYGD